MLDSRGRRSASVIIVAYSYFCPSTGLDDHFRSECLRREVSPVVKCAEDALVRCQGTARCALDAETQTLGQDAGVSH